MTLWDDRRLPMATKPCIVSIDEGILGDQRSTVRIGDIVHWDLTTPGDDAPGFEVAAAVHIEDSATARPIYVFGDLEVPTTHLDGKVTAIWAVAREPWWPGSDVRVTVTRAHEARGSGAEVDFYLVEIA